MYGDVSPVPILTPANILVVGAQQVGKTQLTATLLKDMEYYFSPVPQKILYCYSHWQDKYDSMQNSIKNIEFHQGLPKRDFILEWSNGNSPQLICLDDLMTHVSCSSDIVQLFTIDCHHRNITTIMLNQSLYPVGKYSRTLSLNLTYLIIFKNLRDSLQVKKFGSQMYPGQLDYFMHAYDKATSKPYGYLCIDLNPHANRIYTLRSNILRNEQPIVVYSQ